MRILIAAATILGLAYTAQATEISEDAQIELAGEFSVMEAIYRRQGAPITRLSEARGALSNDANETVPVVFDGPGTYIIIGMCDSACGNLNLAIFDAAGQLIDEDDNNDDHPVVHIQTNDGASINVQASMQRCRAEPCAYGVNVYRH